MTLTLSKLADELATGKTSSRALVEHCLSRIEDEHGEGDRAFLAVYHSRALDQADAVDAARSKGWTIPPYSGIPVSIKDLFDCVGEVTTAGSHVLDNQPPATSDADIVQSLKQAGLIIVGKCNMTEFAYSGLGINQHFGTPRSPFQRDSADKTQGRIPGGSSSGGAVSVSDGMASATIGTDTGGSCRIPAAFCGIVGFKPTSHRVSQRGCVPLSTSLDSIGPLANSVSCCSILDTIISGGRRRSNLVAAPADGLRIGVLEGYTLELMDDTVAANFSAAISRLSTAGVQISRVHIDELSELPNLNSKGGLVGAEAFAWHQSLLTARSEYYDPWVLSRIEFSSAQSAADYIALLNHRKRYKSLVRERVAHLDALVLPTVQIVPPEIASLADAAHSNQVNQTCLRNTAVGNFLDHPSISIPCHQTGTAPTGLMLMATRSREDQRILSIAAGLEKLINAT